MFDDDDGRTYAVVRNDEWQYSLWPADRPEPSGWRRVGVTGTKAECVSHIDQVWTDLRPRSLWHRTDA